MVLDVSYSRVLGQRPTFYCPLLAVSCPEVWARMYRQMYTVQSIYNVHTKKQNKNNNTTTGRWSHRWSPRRVICPASYYYYYILITHNNCFPKCCEVVTTLHEQLGQVEGLWFDSHIVMVTLFIQPQLKTWPRFVPQRFVSSIAISAVSVAYTPASVHRSILFWTCAYYFLLLGWPAVIMVCFWVLWIKILTKQLITVMGV